MEAVTEFGGDQPRVVEVEAADGDGVVEQDAMIGGVEHAGREPPAFTERVARRHVESRMHRQIWALVRALAATGQAIGEAGAIVNIGLEPCVRGQICREAGV